MGRLTTHVLDTMHGVPAAGIRIELYSLGEEREPVKSMLTNADGRCEGPVLGEGEIRTGLWELVFHVGAYFQGLKVQTPGTPFLDEVPVRFGIDDTEAHYHVPLLVSPWSYTTYRGS